MKGKDYYLWKGVKVSKRRVIDAELKGIGIETIKNRIFKLKWDIDRAIEEPVKEQYTNGTR